MRSSGSDPHLIPEGLAGAGNLLMFDNQGQAGFPSARLKVFPGSRALEIDPGSIPAATYVSPYFGPQPFGPAGKKVQSNAVYRAQP